MEAFSKVEEAVAVVVGKGEHALSKEQARVRTRLAKSSRNGGDLAWGKIKKKKNGGSRTW